MKHSIFYYPVLILFFIIIHFPGFSQVIMSDGITHCGCGFTYLDPGGTGDYDNNLQMTQVLCSNGTERLFVVFEEFSLGVGDFLYVYNGMMPNAANLIGVFFGDNIPDAILSTGNYLTFKFASNHSHPGAGWKANIDCVDCTPKSTVYGSPCSSGTAAEPFCTGDNPYAEVSYPSGYGDNSAQSSQGAVQFFNGLTSVGCLGSFPNPAWYFMKVATDGTLDFYIEQRDGGGNELDVDFACWGPFHAGNQNDFMELLCCGYYELSSASPGAGSNMVDCSYSSAGVEQCVISNARQGEWYLLLLTNYRALPGNISFNLQPSSTAETDCSITSPFTAAPVCENDDLFVVIQNQSPPPNVEYELTAPNGQQFRTSNPTITIPNVSIDYDGLYTLVIYSNGVPGPPSSNVLTVRPRPQIVFDNPAICFGQEVTLSAVDINEDGDETYYVWYIDTMTVYESIVTFTPTSEVQCKIYATSIYGCDAWDSTRISFNIGPDVYINPENVCVGSTLYAYPDGNGFSYLWSNGATTQSITPIVSTTTDFYVTVSDEFGCFDSAQATVHINPIAQFTSDNSLVYLEEGMAPVSFLDQSVNAVEWIWDFGDRYSSDNRALVQHPSHIYTQPSRYRIQLIVRSDFGCADSTYRYVEVEAPYGFYIPNAFTPNGDGVNDEFGIMGQGISQNDFSMQIFDRYGQIVFSTNTPGATWDGKDRNGKVCQMDVYICIVRLKTMQGTDKEYIQKVTLIR